MLSDYRSEKWFNIFTEVLLKTLRSAYLSASVADFVMCSIEAMSPQISIPLNDRIVILENLWKVFQNVAPVSQIQITPEIKTTWERALQAFRTPITIDLDRISEIFECKLTFEKAQAKPDEPVNLELYVRSRTDVPFKLKNFAIFLNDTNSNHRLVARKFMELRTREDGDEIRARDIQHDDFMIEPHKFYKLFFSGDKYQFMENVELSVVRLEMQMGSEHQYVILTQTTSLNQAKTFKTYNPHGDFMDDVRINSTCYIIPTFHVSTQIDQTAQPMLLNEYFSVVTNITNSFDVCLENVGIGVAIPPNLRNSVFLATDLTAPTQKLLSQIQIDVGQLQAQSNAKITYYITSVVEGNIELNQKIWYQTQNMHVKQVSPPSSLTNALHFESPPPTKPLEKTSRKRNLSSHNIKTEYSEEHVRKVRDDIVIIPCIEEMQITAKYYTLSRQALMRAYKHEDFVLRLNAEVKGSSIDILDTHLITDFNVTEKKYSGVRKFEGVKITRGTRLEEVHILCSTATSTEWVTKGKYESEKNSLIYRRNRGGILMTTPGEPNKTPMGMMMGGGGISTVTNVNLGGGGMNDSFTGVITNPTGDDLGFNKNLLAKLPTNSTIIGSTSLSNSQMFNLNIAANDPMGNDLMTTSFMTPPNTLVGLTSSISRGGGGVPYDEISGGGKVAGTPSNTVKCIHNRALDAIDLVDGGRRGFFKNSKSLVGPDGFPIFGVFSVRWRRTGSIEENESKFIINGIGKKLSFYALNLKFKSNFTVNIRIFKANSKLSIL